MARLVLLDGTRKAPNTNLAAHRAAATEGESARRLLEDQGYPMRKMNTGKNGKQMEFACPFHEGPGEVQRNKGANFYVHAETSVYFCQSASCGERGNLRTLERHFGVGVSDDDFVSAYKSREEKLREYERALVAALRTPFYEHGLTDQTIERFRLGYEPEHPHPTTGNTIPGRYVIPYLEGRRPKFFRYYQPGGDPKWKYTWEEGAEATLYNAQDAMGDKEGRVFLCEGEQKAMLLVQLGYAAVAVPGAGQWRDEFQAAFTHARHIYVCYDNDNPMHHIYDKPEQAKRCQKCVGKGLDRCAGHNPGQEAALQRVENLGWRAKNVILPLPNDDARKTDINDFFMRDGGTNLDFAQLATGKRSTPFKVLSLAEISANPPEEATFLIEQGILPVGGRLLVAGKPKVGKAQPLQTPVLTPTGWVAMGDLAVGDVVVDQDGEPVKVKQIHPQGEMDIYRVTMSDGSSTECTAEHLWQVQSHNDRVAQKLGRVVDTQTVAEMLADGRDRDTYIPMVGAVEFGPASELPLDPYGLGILLSSGSLGSTPTLRSERLVDALREAFPDVEIRVMPGGGVNLTGGGQRLNPLAERLRALGLAGARTWERFLPAPYLTASVEDRLSLLQGVMDGSGWPQLNRSGNASAVISTSSELLKDGLVELAQSLGGVARARNKTNRHQGGVGRPSWLVTLRLPADMTPFRESEKLARWQNGRTSKNTGPTRRIVKVEPIGRDECQCITVDSDEGLYVTSEYIVTHNSIFVDNIALSLAAGIPFLKRFKVDHPTRTLLLDRELSKWSLFQRLNDLIADRPGYRVAEENLLIDHDHLLRLDQPNALDTLLQLVDQNGAEVFILDTAYKFFGGDVESSSSLMRGFEVIDKVLHETGASVILTHHLKKSQGSGGGGKKENNDVADPDNVAGSFLWTGWPNATILLNYLNRSVENPFNSVATFTAFRDSAAPEPLALYRDRSSIAYSAVQDFSHDEMAQRAPIESGSPTTESVATLLLEMCPTTEDEFLHIAAARWGVSIPSIRRFYIDAMSTGHFEKTDGRPPIIKYKHAGPDVQSWEAEHGLPERPAPENLGEGFEDVSMFDAAGVTP